MHVIQRILGHAQISTTRIYTDPTDPLSRDAADRMGRGAVARREAARGLSADEARHAAARTEALASGDPERIRKALRALRGGPRRARRAQLEVQPGDGDEGSGSGEAAG